MAARPRGQMSFEPEDFLNMLAAEQAWFETLLRLQELTQWAFAFAAR